MIYVASDAPYAITLLGMIIRYAEPRPLHPVKFVTYTEKAFPFLPLGPSMFVTPNCVRLQLTIHMSGPLHFVCTL